MNRPLQIGDYRQTFIDDFVVSELGGTYKVLNRPIKYSGNPILRPSLPWEQGVGFIGTVMRNPNDGNFRAWYQGWFGQRYPACYATSHDGIYWHKPKLGLVEEYGSTTNNRVLNEACVPNVIYDEQDPDPKRRYKMLYWDYSIPRTNRQASVSVAFSVDGIHWSPYEGNPVRTDTGDTHTLLGWDQTIEKYVAYIRPGRKYDAYIRPDRETEQENYIRLIGRSTSEDFTTWSKPEVVLAPEQDEPNLEFYGMPVFIYEGVYIGMPWVYHTYSEEKYSKTGGTTDIQLAISRDGVNWDRAGDRQTFIPLGPAGSMDQGIVSCSKEPIIVGDELWFYLSASDGDHGVSERSANGLLAKLRLDGFISVDAGNTIGTILTKPMVCPGGSLLVNAKTDNGTLAVSVLGETGQEIEGLRMIDCSLFDGNSVRHKITWRDYVDLGHLKGEIIRLKFYLRSAKLYSFRIDKNIQ